MRITKHTKFDQSILGNYLPLAGGQMSGAIDMDENDIENAENVTFQSGVYSHIIRISDVEVGAGAGLRIGLDSSFKGLTICRREHINNVFGLNAYDFAFPTINFIGEDGVKWGFIGYNSTLNRFEINVDNAAVSGSLYFDSENESFLKTKQRQFFWLNGNYEGASKSVFNFSYDAGHGINSANAWQAWVGLYPNIKQSGTAAYKILYMNVNETSIGAGPNLLADWQVASVEKFKVNKDGDLTLAGNLYVNGDKINTDNGLTIGTLSNDFFVMCDTRQFFRLTNDFDGGAKGAFNFDYNADGNALDDDDNWQAWMYLRPNILQSNTASYKGFFMNVREQSIGSGDNLLMDLQIDSAGKFKINRKSQVYSIGEEDTDFDDGDTINTGFGASFGFLIVRDDVDNCIGIFAVYDTSIVELHDPSNTYTITKNNAGTYNVYWEVDHFEVQNKVGDNKNTRVGFFGT